MKGSIIPQLSSELETLLNRASVPIAHVDENRKYWFVRTDGGNYFDAFISGSYIGIGWRDVPLTKKEDYTDTLLQQLENQGYKQATRVLNQVNRFYNEMQKGDIVVIPSTSSLYFAFGFIEDGEVYEEETITDDDIENGECPYIRRRKIRWITGIDRARIDSHLYALFRNHQAISDVSRYSEYIERAINTLYIKDNIAHLTFSVEAQRNPRSLDIPTFMFGLMSRTTELAKELSLIDDTESIDNDLTSRINVQSPGVIEIIGAPALVFLVAIISVMLFGGKAKFEHTNEKTSGELSTEGLAGFVVKILQIYKSNEFIGDVQMHKVKDYLGIKNINDDND